MINHVIPTKVGIQRGGEEHPPNPLTLREGGICTSPSLQPEKTNDGDASERSEIAGDARTGMGGEITAITVQNPSRGRDTHKSRMLRSFVKLNRLMLDSVNGDRSISSLDRVRLFLSWRES